MQVKTAMALDNLVDFIVTCLAHPKAANQTFLVSDGHDLSTSELVRGLAHAAGAGGRGFAAGGGGRRTAATCGLAMTAQSVYNLPKRETF